MPRPDHSQHSKKQLSHARIVQVAARAIRSQGYQGLGVADTMQQAGLTHGGFYAHFASRDALLAEATAAAAAQSQEHWQSLTRQAQAKGQDALLALIDAYMSPAHALAVEQGCPLVALGSETPRQAPLVRHCLTQRLSDMVEQLQAQSGHALQAGPDGAEPPHMGDAALALASLMVGSVMLARAVDDPVLGERLLQAGRSQARVIAAQQRAEPSGSDTEPGTRQALHP